MVMNLRCNADKTIKAIKICKSFKKDLEEVRPTNKYLHSAP